MAPVFLINPVSQSKIKRLKP